MCRFRLLLGGMLSVLYSISVFAQSGVVVVPFGDGGAPAPVQKTGQVLCYAPSGTSGPYVIVPCTGTGQDGESQMGVAWPAPRFTDQGDGTIKDELSGLIWLKNANCSGGYPGSDGKMNRVNALKFVDLLNKNMLLTNCGDINNHDDWRLPNRFELESLLDLSQPPANVLGVSLPPGHPFDNVERDDFYWSSSDVSYYAALGVGWAVSFGGGRVEQRHATLHSPPDSYSDSYVWPVRGGVE